MRDYEMILEQAERLIHKYNQKEDIKQNYGVDVSLTRTEIHMIASIGEEPGIGVKKLAQKKGVTDGAVSQMIRRLVSKELVAKKVSEESEAKIELTLTDKGQICFAEHHKYHVEKNKMWHDLLDKLDDRGYEEVVKLLEEIEERLIRV
nr:MarR family transcriptional regulator [uncultured Clostridium sp.]